MIHYKLDIGDVRSKDGYIIASTENISEVTCVECLIDRRGSLMNKLKEVSARIRELYIISSGKRRSRTLNGD